MLKRWGKPIWGDVFENWNYLFGIGFCLFSTFQNNDKRKDYIQKESVCRAQNKWEGHSSCQ